MRIDIQKLIENDGTHMAAMTFADIGTIEFPSGFVSVLEPMTYFTHIDQEIEARKIAVPGPAQVTAAVIFAGNMQRSFGLCLTFGDAVAVSSSVVGNLSVDVAQMMFADSGMLADSWARDEAAYETKADSLADAISQKQLNYKPISDAVCASENSVFAGSNIVAATTGYGDGCFDIVRHDDAEGNLVRLTVTFLDDDCGNTIDAIDFSEAPATYTKAEQKLVNISAHTARNGAAWVEGYARKRARAEAHKLHQTPKLKQAA